VAALAAALSLVYFFDLAQRLQAPADGDEEADFAETPAPLSEPSDPQVAVRLFFPARSNDLLLRTRNMTIFETASPESRLRQIVDHLVAGADDLSLYGRLPEGTRLNRVFLSGNGTAYLDFTSALSENHPGGILAEQATLYAIVNSLAYNLPDVDRVKLLIGGAEKETLAGHCMLILPLEPDYSISDIQLPIL
jgi:spore germination protein GerM